MSYYPCSASSTAALSSCSSSRYLDSVCSMAALSSRSGRLVSAASLKPSRFTSSASKIIIQCKDVSEIIISYAPEMSSAMGSLNKCYRNVENKLYSRILKKFYGAIGSEHYTKIYNIAIERLLNISNFDPNNLSESLITKTIFCNLFKKIVAMGGENFLHEIFPQADISKPSNVINYCTNPTILERMAQWIERNEDENLLRMFEGLRRTNLNLDPGLLIPLADDASSAAIHERAQNIRNWLRDHNDDLLRITSLRLSGLDLTFIPPEINLFRNLITLNLSDNQIREIHANAFAGLRKLTSLFLTNNHIREIHANAFAGLECLFSLHLDNNQIREIHANVFAGLEYLFSLNLSHNLIREIHTNAFAGLGRLYMLYLDNNHIREIHANAFAGFKSLYSLWLSNNQMTKIGANAFAGLDNLRVTSIDEIYLDYLPYMGDLENNVRAYLLSRIHLTLRGRIIRHFQSNIKIYNIASTALSSVAMSLLSVSMLSSES